ncbi:exopolyphosphatase [Tautonia sociabilis]|uniref:Exopolyphosphatase n=2 Tax=Tautonia sociabilis TaxID=2080755 RepID=A0A432MIE3_9BACT|nr:exopolyphosphatase [Tautonia sociabilis]
MKTETNRRPAVSPSRRSDRFLEAMAPFDRVVLASHINPDPDALASMLGIRAVLEHRRPRLEVTLTLDGMLARAENRAMVELLEIPLVPIEDAPRGDGVALVMVDSQPHTGRRASESITPVAVLDHHQTGGNLDGVAFLDIRPDMGATSTMVAGYLMEQSVPLTPRLATALFYGIESESIGYPREAGPADDGALVWLFPRADKDLMARIRNPRLPVSYFATAQHALANAFLYGPLLVCWCGQVPQPDIIAELADFFIRCDQAHWVVAIGRFQDQIRLSLRTDSLGTNSGEVLRAVVDGLGTAGGHDKRAGGAIPLSDPSPEAIDELLRLIRRRLFEQLQVAESPGRRLLPASPTIQVP